MDEDQSVPTEAGTQTEACKPTCSCNSDHFYNLTSYASLLSEAWHKGQPVEQRLNKVLNAIDTHLGL